jgi:hypothetical protein
MPIVYFIIISLTQSGMKTTVHHTAGEHPKTNEKKYQKKKKKNPKKTSVSTSNLR